MNRKLVLGLAILSLVPMIGCERLQSLPDMVSKRSGLSSSSPIQEYGNGSPIQEYDNGSPIQEYGNGSPIQEYGNGSPIQEYGAGSPIQEIDAASTRFVGGMGQLQSRSLSVGGNQRDYYIYVPRSAQKGRSAPLLLALHGGGGNAARFVERMGLVEMAERYGMIMIVPQAFGRPGSNRGGSWNADSITPSGYAENNGINDLGFLDKLLRSTQNGYSVDPSRVYALGFSKGGMMAYRAACLLPGRISAIAVVSATLSAPDCPNPQGVSVLHIHGTNDQNVPLKGGVGELTRGRGNWPPVSRGLDYFTNGNQCSTRPNVSRPSSDTTCSTRNCAGNEKVQLCLVEGGGHGWPGAQPANWQIRNNVYVSQSFDATDYIARFLLSQ